jgi:hypothetical protein
LPQASAKPVFQIAAKDSRFGFSKNVSELSQHVQTNLTHGRFIKGGNDVDDDNEDDGNVEDDDDNEDDGNDEDDKNSEDDNINENDGNDNDDGNNGNSGNNEDVDMGKCSPNLN